MIQKPRTNHKAILYALGLIILIALIIFSLLAYINHNIEHVQNDFNNQFFELNMRMERNIDILEKSISELGNNLSLQFDFLDNTIKNFKEQNRMDLDTLSNLIDEIEKQSNIQLNKLKDEVRNIKIESADFSAIVDEVLESVVSVSTNVGSGSGVIVDKKGYVVTNYHVINGAFVVRVTTKDGVRYNVNELVGVNPGADVAVLKINGINLKELPFGDSSKLKVGEKVIAAGNPVGLSFTVTEGIVSAFRTNIPPERDFNYIQTDVPINPGNSGGPLINTKAQIVGINNFKVGGFESLGFAISSNDVRDVVDDLVDEYEALLQDKTGQ
jgi:S1-C subfamily serine protease